MARLPYPGPSYVSGVMHHLPERLQRTSIGRMLSYAPTVLTPYYTFSAALLDQLELDPQLRELTILRVAQRTQAQYAWTQHVVLAQLAGVSDEQIAALRQGEPAILFYDRSTYTNEYGNNAREQSPGG